MEDELENISEIEEEALNGRFLTFSLGNEGYGIAIRFIKEIIKIQKIIKVPELPDHVKGIINLRGKIIPVMDVRLRFKKESCDYNERTCIIVADIEGTLVGLIVDSVAEVLAISEENMSDPPKSSTGFNNRFIKKIGKLGNEIKLIVDCEKLFTDEEMSSMQEAV